MDYQFEKLLDRQFQALCQSLLVREYSNVQCMPMGMADGGRDAVAIEPRSGESVIFQVKFSDSKRSTEEPVKWMKAAIDGELSKIETLAARGATRYILITNVAGTSHPDKGSIDSVQQYLDQVCPIPATCWWRDDLNRRLDVNYDLKMLYPNLLLGVDMLRLVLERTPVEGRDRRERTLRAYLGHQHGADEKIRFKQADDLQGSLFRLFVDVPVGLSIKSRRQADLWRHAAYRRAAGDYENPQDLLPSWVANSALGEHGDLTYTLRHEMVGAAELLLTPDPAIAFDRVVVEGAPGQGKSTLAQYLAEVQRVRILDKQPLVDLLSPSHTASPIMLPLKLELRDLAVWLSGEDPWGDRQQSHDRPRSLEAAIAAHISRYSGGSEFSVDDFQQILSETPTLLILDALDEVADLDKRRLVVDAVMTALNRLSEISNRLRVVVTSRPTAVEGAPAFPGEDFMHMTLAAIPPHLAFQYAERWGQARKLAVSDIKEVTRVLKERLDAPHMAELAKNTMQLSILLHLIQSIGSSLPDQRTELYDKYIEVFLNREAEKSPAVRANRKLLVDIHRYLGFHLHAQAERTGGTGRISHDALRTLLRDYLAAEGQEPDLLDKLLTGMVERVVALVSREEGTFEFEVQPLREYFAARHLYDTVRYMPAAQEQSGGKPDRFDGIAQNPYWLNVTRFFAGCFTKGELPGLADQVISLIEAGEDTRSVFPRSLAVSLLQDWVFTPAPPAAKRVVAASFDASGRIWGSVSASAQPLASELAYAGMRLSGPAADSLFETIWPDIVAVDTVVTERIRALCRLLAIQGRRTELFRAWEQELPKRIDAARVAWFGVGAALEVFTGLGGPRLEHLLYADGTLAAPSLLAICSLSGADINTLEEPDMLAAAAAVLNDTSLMQLAEPYPTDVALLSTVTAPQMWAAFVGPDDERRYRASLPFRMVNRRGDKVRIHSTTLRPVLERLLEIARGLPMDGRTSLRPWRQASEHLHQLFGPTWIELELAVIAGGIISSAERGAGAADLHAPGFPLPDRIRNARRRAKQAAWWQAQAEAAASDIDKAFWALAFVVWADSAVVMQLLTTLGRLLDELPAALHDGLVAAASRAGGYSKTAVALLPISEDELRGAALPPVGYALLASRLRLKLRVPALLQHILPAVPSPVIASACLREVIRAHINGQLPDNDALDAAALCQRAGATSQEFTYVFARHIENGKVGADLAQRILERQHELPDCYVLAGYARQASRMRKPEPVMDIATRQRWFS